MFPKRLLLLSVLFVGLIALALLPQPAVAATDAPEGGFTTQIVKGNVEWTIPADQCAELPAGVEVHGTGRRYMVVASKTKSDGSTVIIYNDFVRGTASDNQGGTYNFIYTNQDREQTPAGGGAIQVNMTDTFILDHTNGDNDMIVAFQWKWTYTPPATYWPPVDNWEQNITIGDAFTCDPI